MADRKAATVIVLVREGEHVLVALAAGDPRWRLDRDGARNGMPAFVDGVPTPLPLEGLKFIGGLVDEGETSEEAALRELAEEAGAGMAAAAREAGLRLAYRMRRPLEWDATRHVEISYFVAEVEAGPEGPGAMFAPDDDCLAIVLARSGQVVLDKPGYLVIGIPRDVRWRKGYVPIPYQTWGPPAATLSAMAAYNDKGPADPFVGIDRGSLSELSVPLYCPEGVSPIDTVRDGDPETGRPVPDGAILAYVLAGRG